MLNNHILPLLNKTGIHSRAKIGVIHPDQLMSAKQPAQGTSHIEHFHQSIPWPQPDPARDKVPSISPSRLSLPENLKVS